ncbi:hypothetical protein [Bogoriella caseilytica]|uniref:Uncharacterized protein n=1 Tax=Bogoriella caseilytica TaxID=56055 RepID=A0A3N2BFB2_9MICO|nr:hypothetical protein [Bogoriella caseilytica]ROR73946.1 hypothetical protein EDD31_2341 [Bogoriella caseilytica]
MPTFVRYQSAVPNRRGRFPGIFALANGLGTAGLLSVEDAVWLRAANDRANATYVDPVTVVADCYDHTKNPGARAWFKASAVDLLRQAEVYLGLLDRHRIGWVELRTSAPGRITYEDNVQVVAVPPVYPDHWPFSGRCGES